MVDLRQQLTRALIRAQTNTVQKATQTIDYRRADAAPAVMPSAVAGAQNLYHVFMIGVSAIGSVDAIG